MSHRKHRQATQRAERGFVLITMALAAIVVFACLGLAVDMGRLYIAKNEAQSFADAASLAGVLKLDGTPAGVTAAKTAALGMANKWNFMTATFSGTTVEVAASLAGPWTSADTPPVPATNYSYVRVTATAPVSLYFAPMLNDVFSSTVNARAVSNQTLETYSNEGLFPFSPIAFDGPSGGGNTTSPWGFVAGSLYTMRYASNGKSECPGDTVDPNHLAIGPARGFWGDNSTTIAAGQITGDLQQESLTTGQLLPGVGGAKSAIATSIQDRINQDGDTTDNVYAAYLLNPNHNGRRIIYMPIQSEVDGMVLGFASFLLLDPNSYGHSGNSDWCAVFIGPGVPDSTGPGANPSAGVYRVKLIQ